VYLNIAETSLVPQPTADAARAYVDGALSVNVMGNMVGSILVAHSEQVAGPRPVEESVR
jgi:hypothetical protein